MYCPNCGFNLSEGQVFCPNCGKFISNSGTTPPTVNQYSYVSTSAVSSGVGKRNLQGILVFFSLGCLLVLLDFLPQVWGWNFGFDVDTRLVRLGLFILWLFSTVMAKFLSKFAAKKIKMVVGYGIISLGLALEFFSPSVMLAIAFILPIFVGVILVLSSLSTVEFASPWSYLVGGLTGAALLSVFLGPIFEQSGPRMVILITFGVILICMIALVFLYPNEQPSQLSFSKKQWMFMGGTIGGIYLLLIIFGMLMRLIRGWSIF